MESDRRSGGAVFHGTAEMMESRAVEFQRFLSQSKNYASKSALGKAERRPKHRGYFS
jgi:hypothetical protein